MEESADLIRVHYQNGQEGLVDDVTLNELILTGRIRQFYRLSEDRWVNVEKDPIRRGVDDQPGFGRRATDRKWEKTPEPTHRKFLDRLRKTPKAPEPQKPMTARDWFDQGFLLLFNFDDVPKAIRAFASAIHLDPAYARAYLNRGMAYERIGNLQQAIEDFSRAIDLEPREGKIYYVRGMAHRRLGMAKEALEDFRKADNLGYRSARQTLKSIEKRLVID
jgi:tetratricopeptide (TPR) repeat protein